MHNWRYRKEQKKKKKSETPGKLKGANCHASPSDKAMTKASRSYKWRDYGTFLEKKRKVRIGELR